MRELVRLAGLAMSGRNAQPWRFRRDADGIAIAPDVSRRTPVVDPDDHHLFVGLGCAAENLALAGEALGCGGEQSFDAAQGAVRCRMTARATALPALFPAIEQRRTCRSLYDGRVPASETLSALEACTYPGTHVVFVTDRAQMSRIADLIVEGNTRQMGDAAFMAELKRWVRFNAREAKAKGDGLYGAAAGNPAVPGFLGRAVFSLAMQAKSENVRIRRQIASSPVLAVFYADAVGKAHWLRVGRSAQRFALQATALNLRTAFLNQPVEVADLREPLAALSGAKGYRPDLVLRLGYGPLMPRSFRRPVAAVID